MPAVRVRVRVEEKENGRDSSAEHNIAIEQAVQTVSLKATKLTGPTPSSASHRTVRHGTGSYADFN